MSELYLLRHAKAVPPEEDGPDRDRPLEQRGRRAAQVVARWIAEQRLAPTLVLCSPSLRTRQTLDIVASSFPLPPQILIEDGLYLATSRRSSSRGCAGCRPTPPASCWSVTIPDFTNWRFRYQT